MQMSYRSRRQKINNEARGSCMFLQFGLSESLCELSVSLFHRKGHWDLDVLSAFLNSGTLTRFQKCAYKGSFIRVLTASTSLAL